MALQQQYALEQMSKSAEFQLAHDKQMFDYQNAYNDPSAVLERNLAAGLNPAAVLGQSGVGVSATIPTASGGPHPVMVLLRLAPVGVLLPWLVILLRMRIFS